MIFGTHTTVGLSVGAVTTAGNTPELTLGFKREEAVLMPIVASQTASGGDVRACDMGAAPAADHPCILRGTGKDEQDSLSVLASFGTKQSARAGEINGEVSQYFATGLAARRLAERAGPSAIAVGKAAEIDAQLSGSADLVKAASSPAATAAAQTMVDQIRVYRQQMAANVQTAGDGDFAGYLARVDSAAGTGDRFAAACKDVATASACADLVRTARQFDGIDAENWVAALAVSTRDPASSPNDAPGGDG